MLSVLQISSSKVVDGSLNMKLVFQDIVEIVVSEVGTECTYLWSLPLEFNPNICKKKSRKIALHGLSGSCFPSLCILCSLRLKASKRNSYIVILELQIRVRSGHVMQR